MTYQEEFITFMVRSGVLTFGDFTTKIRPQDPLLHQHRQLQDRRPGRQAGRLLRRLSSRSICRHGITALFGPAYKGIPLAVSLPPPPCTATTAVTCPTASTARRPRTTARAASWWAIKPQAGDVIAIVEDVVTAGTAVRESIALFQQVAACEDLQSVRLGRPNGTGAPGSCSTLDELRKEYGIAVHPIVTVRDIIQFLYERPIDGKVYIDHAMKERMEAYLRQYGAE